MLQNKVAGQHICHRRACCIRCSPSTGQLLYATFHLAQSVCAEVACDVASLNPAAGFAMCTGHTCSLEDAEVGQAWKGLLAIVCHIKEPRIRICKVQLAE